MSPPVGPELYACVYSLFPLVKRAFECQIGGFSGLLEGHGCFSLFGGLVREKRQKLGKALEKRCADEGSR